MADAITRGEWIALSGPAGYVYKAPGGGIVKLCRLFTAEPVAGAATVDSLAPSIGLGLAIDDFRNFGVWLQATGAAPAVTLQLLHSWDDVAAHYGLPEVGSAPLTVADTAVHVATISPTPMRHLRFRLLGGGGNGADTTVTAYAYLMGAGL